MKKRIFFFIFSLAAMPSLHAQDCTGVAEWSASVTYATVNTKVVHLGVLYRSNFWTNNQDPLTNNGADGSGLPWTSEGTCLVGTDGGTGGTGSTGSSSGWSLTGNTAVDGDFVGTTNNKALVLKANNHEGLFVNPETGSVSIGRAVYPSYYKFEVNEGLTAFSGPNQANQNNLMVLYSGNKSTAKYSQGFRHYIGFSHALYPTGVEYAIMNAFEYNATSGIGAGKHMLIQNTPEGNLGIGVYNNPPSHKLSVNGSAAIDGSDFALGRLDGRSQGTKTTNRALVHGTQDELWINYDGDFEGGVKIGGKGLMAKQICVNLTLAWCDYVFEEDYKLMPLKELKSFITQYHRLPEIPSAKELEQEGLNLNNMVTLQMKKIEELTLYTIAQDQKIEDLEERLKKLEQLMESK